MIWVRRSVVPWAYSCDMMPFFNLGMIELDIFGLLLGE